ncbi:MAG: transcription antitermination factor NusB [Alphaproteobacteria bacterium]|nr:transcription antitermination factor NusB [Alphaproteobacteria bacterium]
MEQETKKKKSDNSMRRLARLAAVQGLYQIALAPEAPDVLIGRFRADPGVLLQEEQTVIAVDVDLFSQIVFGVSENLSGLDAMIAGAVDAKLSAERLEPLLKAILRAGAFELLHCAETPEGVIVNDYVDVAHGFFDAKEPGLVNAVLDRLAKKIRS